MALSKREQITGLAVLVLFILGCLTTSVTWIFSDSLGHMVLGPVLASLGGIISAQSNGSTIKRVQDSFVWLLILGIAIGLAYGLYLLKQD